MKVENEKKLYPTLKSKEIVSFEQTSSKCMRFSGIEITDFSMPDKTSDNIQYYQIFTGQFKNTLDIMYYDNFCYA